MKKIVYLLLPLFLLCPYLVKADGLESTPSPTPNYETYTNDISRQEVKSPNIKESNMTPIILTTVTLSTIATTYYFIKKKKSA